MPAARELPDKLLFRIGEVCKLLDVRPHVLRYWETEFPTLRPEKSRTNQRLYHRRDVEQLFEVKRLLYEEGYTIAGARRRLRRPTDAPPPPEETPARAVEEAGSPGLQSPTPERIRVPASAAPQAAETAREARPGEADAARVEQSEAVLADLRARCRALEEALQAERERGAALRQQVRDELEQLIQLAETAAGPDGA